MDIWQAQPWQEDGHLHVGNAEWLLSAYAHFHWELPAALIPRRHCPGDCKDKSPADPPCLDSPEAQAMARRHAAMKVDHCIESCPLNGGVRTNVHDNLQALWVVMLKAAGFQSVRLEDRSWDAEAPRSDKNRRRPDIVCVWGGVRYVIDVTIAWKTEVGHVTERDVGHDADKKAADKERKYAAAMKRQLRGLPGWLANVRLEEVDQFVPLAYEACGSWGQHARDFFNFVKRCAGTEGTRAAELYHWSAMTFGGHWRRRMAVEIGRGRVACLRRSGDRGFEGNSSSEAETAFDSM